jgi:hypothetical protein
MVLLVKLLFLMRCGLIGLYSKVYNMKTIFTTALFCLLLSDGWAQQLDSASSYWWTGSTYNRTNTLRYEYDVNDRLTGYKTFSRDGNGVWREVSRSTYFYNSQGLPLRLVTMNVDAMGNLDSGQTMDWQYTANNLISVETKTFWAGTTRIIAETTNQYDAGGRLDSSWLKNNNGGPGGPTFLEVTHKYHYAGGNLVSTDRYVNNSSGLQRSFRVVYAYDALTRLQEELSYSWVTQSSSFALLSDVDYFYTGTRALPDSLKGVEGLTTPGNVSSYKREFTYDANDSLLLSETFDGTTGSWVPLWKQTFAYLGFGAAIPEAELLNFMVYPNPATDQLHIQLADLQLATVSIQSLSGQTIKQLVLATGQSSINLQDLPTGMYLLHLQSGGKSAVHKLIKQ